jgi:hypothetical protein
VEVADLARALAGPGAERVRLLVCGDAAAKRAHALLDGVSGVEIVRGLFGDIWLRDTGPIFGKLNGQAAAAAFRFNGWGGNTFFDRADRRYHVFTVEMTNGCPIGDYITNSQIVHATADSPLGPFAIQSLALPPFHHNPTIIGPTPDGYYLIYSIGNTNTAVEQIPCEQAVPAHCDRAHSFCRGSHMPNSNGRINLAYSKSVHGPWTEKVILPYDADNNASAWNCENNNPTATILKNGTIFLVYRADPCKAAAGGGAGGGESLGVATAEHWSVRLLASATCHCSPCRRHWLRLFSVLY